MLGTVEEDWNAISRHETGQRATAHPLAARLREVRVGGAFWGDAPQLHGDGLTLMVTPDPASTTRIDRFAVPSRWWTAAAARWEPGNLVCLPPSGSGYMARRSRNAAVPDGSQVADRRWDPHALLDRMARLVLADRAPICDVAVLALLRGIPVLRNGREEDPSKALALLLDATRYRDPFTGGRIDAEAALELLRDWKRVLANNRTIAVCTGMAWWKRRRMAELFARAEPGQPVRFRRGAAAAVRVAVRHGGAVVVWSTRVPRGLDALAAAAGVPVARVEDGFIRSAGLGSGLLPPASVVVDGTGLYLDPRAPSDLERILATHPFDDATRERGRHLVARLVAGDVSKYAAGGSVPTVSVPAGRRVVLVPGQVADDLSVTLGGGGVGNILELLRRVRSEEPDAWIVFRPHPDVEAGHRRGAVPDGEALRFADQISRGGSITRLIERVDAVHTLTSLAGFEAVLRRKPVICWGQPFYAGWGLTEDRAPVARRKRRLTVDELAAGCLLVYPRYVDPLTGLPCGPELVIDRLGERAPWRPGPAMRLRALQGGVMLRFRRAVRGREAANA